MPEDHDLFSLCRQTIKVSFWILKGRFFLIGVKNSFVGEVIFGQDGLPVTTKQEDAPMHGIGLANVRREAEKYMGELELKAVQREFSATVLLQERSSL